MKKGTYLFFIAFLAGVVIANFQGIASGKDMGAMGEYYMNRYLYTTISGKELFVYLFYERVPKALLLLLLSIGIGIWVIHGYVAYLGVSVGFLSVVSIINYGVKGIFLVVGFLFPQWICYGPICFAWYLFLKERKMGKREFSPKERIGKRGMKRMGYLLTGAILMFCGIFLESYVNPHILRGIIRNM